MARKTRKIKGKHEAFTARLTLETREVLEEEAALSERTLSSEIEVLLGEAIKARRAARNEVDTVFEHAWDAARRVIAEHGGSPPSASKVVYGRIVEILQEAISKVPSPQGSPDLPAQQQSGSEKRAGGGEAEHRQLGMEIEPNQAAKSELQPRSPFGVPRRIFEDDGSTSSDETS